MWTSVSDCSEGKHVFDLPSCRPQSGETVEGRQLDALIDGLGTQRAVDVAHDGLGEVTERE